MANTRLHLDADVSYRVLEKALRERGHDVSRTPNEWMPLDASDRQQLIGATSHGRIILTFNISDFVQLAQEFPEHGGIVLANQSQWHLSSLITALDRLLLETDTEIWAGQVRWLNDWREPETRD